MSKIIAIVNQKGGVGKTTTSVNLAASLGTLEKKVLLIDLDPQSNATSWMGFQDYNGVGIYEVIEGRSSGKKAILKTQTINVCLIPSSINLVAFEVETISIQKREFLLKKALNEVAKDFDYILIDCSPSLGLLTINALTASEAVIIPVQCEYYALEGLGKLLNTIKIVQKLYNPGIDIDGLLLTMYDSRLRLSNQVAEELNKHFKELVFNTIIYRNTKLSEASSYSQNILQFDINSKGADDYIELAKEFLIRNQER